MNRQSQKFLHCIRWFKRFCGVNFHHPCLYLALWIQLHLSWIFTDFSELFLLSSSLFLPFLCISLRLLDPLSSQWLCLCSRECFKGSTEIITASVLWKSKCSFCHGNKSSSLKQCRGNGEKTGLCFLNALCDFFFNLSFIALLILLYSLTGIVMFAKAITAHA